MKINTIIAVFSHLTDAEDAIELGNSSTAIKQIEYAKAIVKKYMDSELSVEDTELDSICKEVNSKQQSKF